MQSFPTDQQKEQDRIRWLIRLRWVAVVGVLAVVTAAGPLMGIVRPSRPLFFMVALLALWNGVLHLRHRRGLRVQGAAVQVMADLTMLGALLVFSGGLRNPFSVFLAVQLVMGAILLPRRSALGLGAWAAGLVLLLTGAELLDMLPSFEAPFPRGSAPGFLGLWGSSLALLITLGVALYFTIGIMEDLRTRGREVVRYHEEAERERRVLRDVVRSVGAGLVMLDADLRVEWLNRHAKEILGEAVRGARIHIDDGRWPSREVLASGRTQEREWRRRDAGGRPRLYDVSAAPVSGRNGSLEQVILLLVDVTERRAAKEQLQRTEKLAALGRLAAGLAHEISTPLGSVNILGTEARAALPGCDRPEGRREVAGYLEDMQKEVARIGRLVRRLLDLGHPGEQQEEQVDVRGLLEEAVRLISVRAGGSRAPIAVELADPLPPVMAHRDRLLQVLLNVLDNAVDATRGGGGIAVRARGADGHVEVLVEDEGVGIEEPDLQRVFDPFFTTKEVGEGTGLGLYVTYEIMRNLGGDVKVESRPGAGTRVHLKVPLNVS